MRHPLSSFAIGCALVAGSTAWASDFTTVIGRDGDGGTVSGAIRFGAPVVEATRGGVSVDVDGLGHTVSAGMPSVPVRTFKLALPAGARVVSARLENATRQSMRGAVERSVGQIPFSWNEAMSAKAAKADAPVVPAVWPVSEVEVATQRLHGVDIAVVNVYPVRATGDGMSVIEGGRLVVTFEGGASAMKPMFDHQVEAVRALVDNGDEVDAPAREARANAYDYLIITPSAFASYTGQYDMAAFQNNLGERGLKARVLTTEEIAQNGTGADMAAKVRNRIRDEYTASGIRYVLLAADGDKSGAGSVIKPPSFYGKVLGYNGSWQWIEQKIPTDFYFGCLDGDFNGNNNDKWGEPTDGVYGADVDMLAEVTVGRMPMKTTTELANFVRKTIAYTATGKVTKTFLMGEVLFAEKGWYGGDYMDQLVGQCVDHNYETNGYGADWSVERLYDSKSGTEWSSSQALQAINRGGFSMINHLGHSNQTYNMRMSSSWSFPSFSNAAPFFFYTQGCFPGDFTYNDSFIEKLVRHTNGAVAAVANTSYGLGPEDPAPETTKTPGASQMLHRRFVNAVISGGVASLGRANQVSKEQYIGIASAPEIRWVFWDANYFGDPSLVAPTGVAL